MPRCRSRGPWCAGTSSEHLRGPGRLDLDLVTRGDEFAGDHLGVALPRTDHGIDAGIRVDHHFEEGGTRVGEELADDARHIRLALEARRVAEAVGRRPPGGGPL